MAFINEIISDADVEAYGLELQRGMGHWWTRDKERDLYLLGGIGGNPLWDQEVHGRFDLYIAGATIKFALSPGKWSQNWHVKPYVIVWDALVSIEPDDCGGLQRQQVIDLLKEALIAYGRDGMENRNTPDRIVRYCF